MDACRFSGNADMFGLGIRLGYYLQWVATLASAWLSPDDFYSLRLSTSAFIFASFLALVIQVARPPVATSDPIAPGQQEPEPRLRAVEIHVVLLLTFGSALFAVPLYLWRFATRFDPARDPTRFPRTRSGSATFKYLHQTLVMAVAAFQIWFWVRRVEEHDVGEDEEGGDACEAFGFLFTRVRLDSPGLRWLNVAMAALLLAIYMALRVMKVLTFVKKDFTVGKPKNPAAEHGPSPRKALLFQVADTAIKFMIAVVIITATELTVEWNGILGVNSVSSAGQLIPLVIGAISLLQVLYRGRRYLFKLPLLDKFAAVAAVPVVFAAGGASMADWNAKNARNDNLSTDPPAVPEPNDFDSDEDMGFGLFD